MDTPPMVRMQIPYVPNAWSRMEMETMPLAPHVHWSNPLVIGQEPPTSNASTHDINFGEMLQLARQPHRIEQTFVTTFLLHRNIMETQTESNVFAVGPEYYIWWSTIYIKCFPFDHII